MLNRQWLEVLWAAVDCLKTAFIQTPGQHLNANLSVPNQVHYLQIVVVNTITEA